MAGKITHRHGTHPSRIGSMVPNVDLSTHDLSTLSAYVGHALDDAGRSAVVEFIQVIRCLIQEATITNQDVSATLANIGAGAISAQDAMADCDERTEIELHLALRRIEVTDFSMATPDQIRAAALLAGACLPKKSNGRPETIHRKIFYGRVPALFQHLGGNALSISVNERGEATPLVSFARYLLDFVELDHEGFSLPEPSTIAKELRKVLAHPLQGRGLSPD